jgi:hypothetical protein
LADRERAPEVGNAVLTAFRKSAQLAGSIHPVRELAALLGGEA